MLSLHSDNLKSLKLMEKTHTIENLHIIILAGGLGKRLWPVSRRSLPKQFLDIFGTGETMLQTAVSRAIRLVGEENVLVVTSKEFQDITVSQLPSLSKDNILLEPVHRNTCPAAAWAVHRVKTRHPEHAVAIMPSDQLILHEDRFERSLRQGAEYVRNHDTVVSVGVTPTRTEPGYGYIQVGEAIAHDELVGAKVKSFIEKPEREFAKMLIESGEFLWNTGIYMARSGYIAEQFKTLLPVVLRDVTGTMEEENEFVRLNYSKYPNLSLDLAILEKMPDRTVLHADFGWADIGTWHGIYEALANDADDNVVVNEKSRVIAENSACNVLYLQDGKLAVISGMDGMIVAEKDNVLLICPKGDSSAMVRKFLAKIENDDTLNGAT